MAIASDMGNAGAALTSSQRAGGNKAGGGLSDARRMKPARIEAPTNTGHRPPGVTRDGRKEPLGVSVGSTENAAVCTQLLQDVLARGLAVEGRLLCVIDGARACAPPCRMSSGTSP